MPNLLEGADAAVAKWTWHTYQIRPIDLYRAVGVLDRKNNLTGAILLSNYNGFNIEVGYYGRDTMTFEIIRWLGHLGLNMGLSRATFLTSKKNKHILRFLPRIGGRLEGVSRCYYGMEDRPRNAAVRFVIFREDMKRIAFGPQAKESKVA